MSTEMILDCFQYSLFRGQIGSVFFLASEWKTCSLKEIPPQCSRAWLIEKGTSISHFCLSYNGSLMSLWRAEQWKGVFISLLPILFPTSLCCCTQPWFHWAPQWPLTEPNSLGPACLGVPWALQRAHGPQLSWNCQVPLVAWWWLGTSPLLAEVCTIDMPREAFESPLWRSSKVTLMLSSGPCSIDLGGDFSVPTSLHSPPKRVISPL